MKELRDQVEAYERNPEGTFVLATVVATQGSTYRKVGARLLLDEHTWLSGAISGGCVERDLLRKAFWRTAATGRALVTYHGAQDEDDGAIARGFGLGCDGSIEVLLERVAPGAAVHPLACLQRVLREREEAVLATVLPGGEQCWIFEDGSTLGDVGGLTPSVQEHARRLLSRHEVQWHGGARTVSMQLGTRAVRVSYERLVPPPRLFVFGQNYDALPLCHFAHQLGWDVTLVAEREPHRARHQPGPACKMVLGGLPEVVPRLSLDAHSFVVVMGHNLARDKRALEAAFAHGCRYVGALGPARRTQRLLDALRDEGCEPSAPALASLHAPVGLDLGASTPEEIALSIMAELQQVLRGGRAARLGAHFTTENAARETA